MLGFLISYTWRMNWCSYLETQVVVYRGGSRISHVAILPCSHISFSPTFSHGTISHVLGCISPYPLYHFLKISMSVVENIYLNNNFWIMVIFGWVSRGYHLPWFGRSPSPRGSSGVGVVSWGIGFFDWQSGLLARCLGLSIEGWFHLWVKGLGVWRVGGATVGPPWNILDQSI